MRGFCKWDLCGDVYHEDENKNYDGIMVWFYDRDGDIICGKRDIDVTGPDGKLLSTVPEMMDVCPKCFERFCNFIKATRGESKSNTNNNDFPMNPPE